MREAVIELSTLDSLLTQDPKPKTLKGLGFRVWGFQVVCKGGLLSVIGLDRFFWV